jgi:hypothetical protein
LKESRTQRAERTRSLTLPQSVVLNLQPKVANGPGNQLLANVQALSGKKMTVTRYMFGKMKRGVLNKTEDLLSV